MSLVFADIIVCAGQKCFFNLIRRMKNFVQKMKKMQKKT